MTMIIGIAIVSTLQTQAQQGLNMNLKLAPQMTGLLNGDDIDNAKYDLKPTFNYALGLGLSYNFKNNMGIGAEVYYSTQGQRFKFEEKKYNQKLDYIKVPVYFSYSSNPESFVSVTGRLGTVMGILVDARLEDGDGNDILNDNSDTFEDYYFGAMTGIDVNFRVSEKLYLTAGAHANMGFTDAENEDRVGYVKGRATSYNVTTGIDVGLKYNFGF